MSCINETNNDTILRISERLEALKDSFEDCVETDFFLQEAELPSQELVHPALDAAVEQDVASMVFENSVHISGSFSQVRAARRTLKKYGTMDSFDCSRFPLNGHWKTEHGLVVVIEKKTVRWTPQRASRLHFTGVDRCSCSLSMYGEAVQGRLVTDLIPGIAKSLTWSNGTVWHSIDGSIVGQATMLSQTMTDITRDSSCDEVIRSRAAAALTLVSKNGLHLPVDCLHDVMQCIGSTTYSVQLRFRSNEKPPWTAAEESDFLSRLAQHHPLCQICHEWSDENQGSRGQRIIS